MERKVTVTATPSKVKTISVNKATVANEIVATPDTSLYYSNLSKQWATKMDSLVVGEDYSSKYYAENAKISAETAKMEASTATGLKDLLKEDFDEYTESLNNTKNLAIEEINTTSTVAIGNINTVVTSSTEQINAVAKEQTELVDSTANKALEDIETLVTNSTDVIESLSEKSTEEINTLGNTIKSDATDWIDVINATGKSYKMVTHRQLTNCITEIPQDIKLELNNGVLTLKAGSKVCVPNGAGVFDEVVINSDLTYGGSSTNWSNTSWLVYCPNGTLFVNNGYYTSGSTYTGGTYGIWYDTTNNSVKFTTDGGSTWASGYSLPLAQITVKSGTGVTSIDRVFNGFGYIGSTVFVTKGVKGLMPNGRNEDGSLNNIEFVTDKVLTRTIGNGVYCFGLELSNNDGIVSEDSITIMSSSDYYESSLKPNTNIAKWFNTLENQFYYFNTGHSVEILRQLYKVKDCTFGFVEVVNGAISNFNPKHPFRAVDYNEFNSTSHIVEAYRNGQSWYVLYSNGWCEQGGVLVQAAHGTFININLLKPYKDRDYNVNAWSRQLGFGTPSTISCDPANVNYIQIYNANTASATMHIGWEAKGYIR